MSEIDEIRFNNLENRVTKIEEYIKCSEEAKEQEWREWGASVDKKLEAIGNRQIRTAWQWPFSLGVSAMAVGLTWFIATMPKTPGDFKSAVFVFSSGVLIVILSLIYWYRKKS